MQNITLKCSNYFLNMVWYFNIIFSIPISGRYLSVCVLFFVSFHLTVISKVLFFIFLYKFCTHFLWNFCCFVCVNILSTILFLVPLQCWVFIFVLYCNDAHWDVNDNCIVCIHFSFLFLFLYYLIYWISVSFMNDLNKRNFSSIFCWIIFVTLLWNYLLHNSLSLTLSIFVSVMLFSWVIIMQFVWMMAIINYLIKTVCEWDRDKEREREIVKPTALKHGLLMRRMKEVLEEFNYKSLYIYYSWVCIFNVHFPKAFCIN